MAPAKTGAILLFVNHRLGNALPRTETSMASDEKECERCGATIPQRRMEVLPYTRLCIECSEAIGGDFKTYVIPVNTGKPGSLKKNYGSWTVKRKLRPITPIEKK
jgi:hypothetical protein